MPVLVLPLSVHYRRDEQGIGKIEALVADLERRCGVASPGAGPAAPIPSRRAALKTRLVALDLALLDLAESLYGLRPTGGSAAGVPGTRDSRLAALINAALERGETMLGIGKMAAAGEIASLDTIGRVYRIRQEGWDRIYPERDVDAMKPLERQLADLASRLVGGDISRRPEILRKRAIVLAAEPIDVSARLSDHRRDRKAAVTAVTAEIAKAFKGCIREYPGS